MPREVLSKDEDIRKRLAFETAVEQVRNLLSRKDLGAWERVHIGRCVADLQQLVYAQMPAPGVTT